MFIWDVIIGGQYILWTISEITVMVDFPEWKENIELPYILIFFFMKVE